MSKLGASARAAFVKAFGKAFTKSTITTPSDWACQYRYIEDKRTRIVQPWSFRYTPWLKEMHNCPAGVVVGQKSAQMGYTETMLNKVFYEMDINNTSCLYVLPSKTPDATDFSVSRFDPAIEASTYLADMFSDVKNVGLKRAGGASLFIRGSRSKSGLKSVPCGLILLDEVEEMTQENIPLVRERASGQFEKMLWMISTPTIEDRGINKEFKLSTQNSFFFICPHCGKYIDLTFPESLSNVDDPSCAQLICKLCHHVLDHATKPDWLATGIWVPAHADRETVGYYINQLYSCTITPKDLSIGWLDAQLTAFSEQEFYNSKLGLPHTVAGAQVTDSDIEACTGTTAYNPDMLTAMGVDVGKELHYEIANYYNYKPYQPELADAVVVETGSVKDFDELDTLMHKYNVHSCVIDANPETRLALQFSQRFYQHAHICYYNYGLSARELGIKENVVTANRTCWLDLALGRFKNGSIRIPPNQRDYMNQIKAPVRILRMDQHGNPFAVYDECGKADHLAHARNYCEIAAAIAVGATSEEATWQ